MNDTTQNLEHKIFVIKNPLTLKLHIKSMEPHLLYNRYSKRNLSKH